jgi:MoxR-like ATPase
VQAYVARLVEATHPQGPRPARAARRWVRYGASPRGAQALLLGAKARALACGRAHASAEDVRAVAPAALRHRLLLNFEAEAEGVDPDQVVREVVEEVPEEAPASAGT